jgi:hypothetical protein
MSKKNKILISLLLTMAVMIFILIYPKIFPPNQCEKITITENNLVITEIEAEKASTILPTQEGDIIWICMESES